MTSCISNWNSYRRVEVLSGSVDQYCQEEEEEEEEQEEVEVRVLKDRPLLVQAVRYPQPEGDKAGNYQP